MHVNADDPLAQTQFTDEDERVAYVQDKIDRSVVAASDIPEAADIAHTFALATCDNLPTDGRYVLYAVPGQQHGGGIGRAAGPSTERRVDPDAADATTRRKGDRRVSTSSSRASGPTASKKSAPYSACTRPAKTSRA